MFSPLIHPGHPSHSHSILTSHKQPQTQWNWFKEIDWNCVRVAFIGFTLYRPSERLATRWNWLTIPGAWQPIISLRDLKLMVVFVLCEICKCVQHATATKTEFQSNYKKPTGECEPITLQWNIILSQRRMYVETKNHWNWTEDGWRHQRRCAMCIHLQTENFECSRWWLCVCVRS